MANASLTCQACHLLFNAAEEHRLHYRSDLHRLNAKRRAAGLVPISQGEFDERAKELLAAAPAEPAPAEFPCAACERTYHSAQALEQHLATRKHKETQLASGKPAPASAAPAPTHQTPAEPSAAATEEEVEQMLKERLATARRIPANECLFCAHTVTVTTDVAEAVTAHMASVHSFFIPDVEYLADLPGLLRYLGEKAAVGYACFYCPRSFWSLEAVRGHMRDTSHCKIKYDTDEEQEEFDEYYDFSKTQPGDAPVAKEGEAPATATTEVEGEDRVQVSEDGFSLHLNGKSVGHRALRMYYKQAAPRHARPAASESARAITQVVGAYRLLGWSGSAKGAQLTAQARHERKAAQKAASLALNVGVRQNRIQKNHPRDQTTIF